MMFSPDEDLQELEAMLYSQIYHGNTGIEADPLLTTTVNITSPTGIPKINTGCCNNLNEFDPKNSQGINDATAKTTGCLFTNPVNKSVVAPPYQKQDIPHLEILARLLKIENWPKGLKYSLRLFERGKLSRNSLIKKLKKEIFLLKSRGKREQKRKDKKEKSSKMLHERVKQVGSPSSEVICILDGDDGEQPENDDEIIYVAPPPVPVISIDTDSEEENEKNMTPKEQEFKVTPEEEISNDFIGNHEEQNSSQIFNFSLHGSDFANNEFVRPANPSEAYETESSTSTSEFAKESSRNFNNSVKTIVFNEVEFPKEDIFTANLDSFQEFVNSSQSNICKSKGQCSSGMVVVQKKKNQTRTSSDSSSESDYETPLENLPNLSPMLSKNDSKSEYCTILDTSAGGKQMKRNIEQVYGNEHPKKTQPSSSNLKRRNRRKKKKSTQKSPEEEVSHSVVAATDNSLPLEQSVMELAASNSNQTAIADSTQEDSTKMKAKKRKPKDDDGNGENNSSVAVNESEIGINQNITEAEKQIQTVSDPEVIIVEEEISHIEILDSSSDSIDAVEVIQDLRRANASELSLESHRDFEEFDVENLQKKMSDDPVLWQISAKDRLGTTSKKGIRCRRCREFGHIALHCTNNVAPPSCTLCGNVGHREPRCPNKVCFSCGNAGAFSTIYCWKCVKNRSKVCDICGIYGHISRDCPDIWRRYHLTTKAGPLMIPKQGPLLRPRTEQWCAGCAQQGHLDFECDSYKYIRDYPATSPEIFHYSDIYSNPQVYTDNVQRQSTSQDTAAPMINNAQHLSNSNLPVLYPPQNIFPAHQQNAPLNQLHNILNPLPLINPNLLPNPLSVLMGPQGMPLNVPQNIPYQIGKYATKFRDSSLRDLIDFVEGELSKLQGMNSDAKYWKKKLLTVENLKKTKSERSEGIQKRINFTYKLINMYVFGVRKLKDGKRHLDNLRNFIYQPGYELRGNKRKMLFDAYSYIFGNQHQNVNYHRLLNNLIVNSKMGRPLI